VITYVHRRFSFKNTKKGFGKNVNSEHGVIIVQVPYMRCIIKEGYIKIIVIVIILWSLCVENYVDVILLLCLRYNVTSII
jgi:hypothetical protein